MQILLRSLRGEEEVHGALLPLLWSLLDALRPRIPPTDPYNGSGTQEAIFRLVGAGCGGRLLDGRVLAGSSCMSNEGSITSSSFLFGCCVTVLHTSRHLLVFSPLPRSMLARLLEHGGPLAQLLPPLSGPTPGTGRAAVVSKALHSFWTAVASDALLCCKQPVWQHLEEPRRQLYCTKLQADGPPRLLPRDMDPAANAPVNTVSGLCGGLVRQWTVNVEQPCMELSKQLELLRREAALQPSGAAPALPPAPAMFRPGDFGWTLAHSTLHLFSAFLHAHLGSGEAAGQPSPGSAGAAAEAGGSPVGAAAGAAVAAAGGAVQRWQDLQPGQQWAFGCLFAPARLVLLGHKLAKPLQDAYLRLQEEVRTAVGPLMPKGVCMAPKGAQQPAAAQPQLQSGATQPQPSGVQPQPEASCMGGNSMVTAPAALPQRQQQQPPPQLRQQSNSRAAPAASCIGASSVAAWPAQRQQQQVKQEPLSQPAGPAAAQRSQQPPAALGPRQEVLWMDRDVSFLELAGLRSQTLVQLVGYLRRRPTVKVRHLLGVALVKGCRCAVLAVLPAGKCKRRASDAYPTSCARQFH